MKVGYTWGVKVGVIYWGLELVWNNV